MATFSQLKVSVGDSVTTVDRVSDDTNISSYIQSKCDLAGIDVSVKVLVTSNL